MISLFVKWATLKTRASVWMFSTVTVHKGDQGQLSFFLLFVACWLSRYRKILAASGLSKPRLAVHIPLETCTLECCFSFEGLGYLTFAFIKQFQK